MTYFEKILETHPPKEAARIAFDNCPGDFFEGAPMISEGCKEQYVDAITCGDCWFTKIPEEPSKERIEEIRNAMKALGYREGGHVSLRHISGDRVAVYRKNKRFGIYDFEKHAFVD